jgi:X-Pro dipeptidyl-peptidase
VVDLVAAVPGTQENYGALLVDYGAGTQVTRGGEGISNTTNRTCWGDTSTGGPDCTIGDACTASAQTIETACYLEVSKPTQAVTQWRVTRGTLDSSNRNSLFYTDATPLTPNAKTRITFPTFATEHIFKAGHQIGVVVVGNLFGANAQRGTATSASAAQPITIDAKQSKIILPVLGGYKALAEAGGTDAETVAPVMAGVPADITVSTADADGIAVTYTPPTATDNEDPNPTVTCTPASGTKFTIGSTVVTCTAKDANGNTSTKSFNVIVGGDSPVGGTVPATLALTMGAPVQFGAFTPGVAKDYTAGTTATVLSTAGDATLSVADPSPTNTGKLVNGTFALATPLQGLGVIKTWTAPTSNEVVPITFTQSIAANEPLRTGTYAKTLTFTLSTTTP